MPPITDGIEAMQLTIELLQRIPQTAQNHRQRASVSVARRRLCAEFAQHPAQLKPITDHLYQDCRFEGCGSERTSSLYRSLSAEAGTMAFQRPRKFLVEKKRW